MPFFSLSTPPPDVAIQVAVATFNHYPLGTVVRTAANALYHRCNAAMLLDGHGVSISGHWFYFLRCLWGAHTKMYRGTDEAVDTRD